MAESLPTDTLEKQTDPPETPSSGTSAMMGHCELSIKKVYQFSLPDSPRGVACDKSGNVAVCQGYDVGKVFFFMKEGKNKLIRITPRGLNRVPEEGVSCITTYERQDGTLCDVIDHKKGVFDVVSIHDRWYITHSDALERNGDLFIYYKRGQYLGTVNVDYYTTGGIAASETHLYITSSSENIIYRLKLPNCTDKEVFIKNMYTWSTKYLDEPWFVATNGKTLAVANSGSCNVSVFDMNGRHQFTYGEPGKELGQLSSPWGVAMDSEGRVLVADSENDRISIVSPQGQHMADIRLSDDGLKLPRGLTLTSNGHILVACSNPYAVAVYQYLA